MTLNLGWPQIIWIILTIMGLCLTAYNHGKTQKYIGELSPCEIFDNFWVCLLAKCILIGILYWGGFFG